MNRRDLAAAATGAVLVILTLVLRRVDEVGPASCLICGPRGLADAILGVLLFVPVGLVLSHRRWLPGLSLSVAAALIIEGGHLVAPWGRPRAGLLLFHVIGATAGIGLGRVSRYLVRPSQYVGDRLATIAAILVAVTIPLTAWVSEQDLPDPPYSVEWETSRAGLVEYPGDVLVGGIQPLPLTPGPSGRGEAVKRLLERGSLFGVLVEVGAPTEGLAPLLALYDAGGKMVALLGVDGSDLIYRERTRASRLRLDNPELRAPGALESVAVGERVQIASGVVEGKRCFLVREALKCGYGISGDSGWRFLHALNGASPALLTAVSVAWLALLLFPVGYWARWHLALGLAAAVAGYAWVVAPAEVGLLPVPPIELSGIAIGVAAGILTRRAARPRREIANEAG